MKKPSAPVRAIAHNVARTLVLCAPLLGLPLSPAVAEECKHSEDRSETFAGPVPKVVIDASAGELKVSGGGKDVKVQGRACSSAEDLLSKIALQTRREGDTVYIETVMPDAMDSLFNFSRYAYMDLSVEVPPNTEVRIDDSSGDLVISGVRSAIVNDTSGDLSASDVFGDLDVTDSSGEITMKHIGGKLSLEDSSGDIDVEDVRGNVVVDVDTSGDMRINNVGGEVHIVNDSSGDIKVSEVKRNVRVDSDTSGNIEAIGVGGNFTVGTDSSGEINQQRVMGTVRIPARE
jgi:DUF4097 and DUF4098 domain-containing protein YvlB